MAPRQISLTVPVLNFDRKIAAPVNHPIDQSKNRNKQKTT